MNATVARIVGDTTSGSAPHGALVARALICWITRALARVTRSQRSVFTASAHKRTVQADVLLIVGKAASRARLTEDDGGLLTLGEYDG